MNNEKTVWVVYNDTRKNMVAAEKHGKLKDVFSSIGRHYSPDKIMAHARTTLQDWQEGDCLLMVGDPVLCAVCVAIVSETEAAVPVLRWDNTNFNYARLELNFDYHE